MDIVHPRVAGIDVHKKVIWVAVRLPGETPGERAVTVRKFATFWRSLQKMAAWLAELGVTDAAMESTGICWWPVYHALAAAGIEACVCNAAHMRNVPGRKTDLKDCQWIAELHEHGLLRASFIPGPAVAAPKNVPPSSAVTSAEETTRLMIRSISYSWYFSTATPMQTGSAPNPTMMNTVTTGWVSVPGLWPSPTVALCEHPGPG